MEYLTVHEMMTSNEFVWQHTERAEVSIIVDIRESFEKQLPYDIFSEFLIGIVYSERVRRKYNMYMQHIIKFSTIVNDILTTIL